MRISYLVVLGGIFTGVLCDPSHPPRLCYSNVWCVAGIATTEFSVQHVLYTIFAFIYLFIFYKSKLMT